MVWPPKAEITSMARSANNKTNRSIDGSSNCEVSAVLEGAADLALAARLYEIVEIHAGSLMSCKQPASACIGAFYKGLATYRGGQGDAVKTRAYICAALRFAPSHYRQRALLALAHLAYQEGDYSLWVKMCERLAMGDDPVAVVEARRALAIARSLDRNHHSALARLEALYPLVMNSASLLLNTRLDYLNSLAVELNEVGRVDEAYEIASKVSLHPLSAAYPEFQDTLNAIRRPATNVLAFPVVLRPVGSLRAECGKAIAQGSDRFVRQVHGFMQGIRR
jgi:hypothetical protein